MPSKSPKQARTMRAAKHDPEFAAKMGIPQDVASEFVAADKKEKGKPKSFNKMFKKGKPRAKKY